MGVFRALGFEIGAFLACLLWVFFWRKPKELIYINQCISFSRAIHRAMVAERYYSKLIEHYFPPTFSVRDYLKMNVFSS